MQEQANRQAPVLDAGAGLHDLKLGSDTRLAASHHLVQVHQRGLANQLINKVAVKKFTSLIQMDTDTS
jgi:hypothetical protein